METLKYIIQFMDTALLLYFLFAGVYFLVFALASLFYQEKKSPGEPQKINEVAVIVPAFKEDKVILDTVRALVKNPEISDTKNIWVIADSLLPVTKAILEALQVSVLPVVFENSTKTKSVRKVLEHLKPCDYVIVLDADNIPADNFFEQMDAKMNEGFRVVQGHRTAKNSNTAIATLDAISEEVNNAIFRRGHRVLGLSASLIGSAFACEYTLFKNIMLKCEAVGGFDKELELLLIEQKVRIGYAQDALVLDEKIQYEGAFVNQRRRWIAVQFIYFRRNILNGFVQLITKGNVDYFDKLIQFFVPPRVLALGFSLLMTGVHLLMVLFNGYLPYHSGLWVFAFLSSALAVLVVIPKKYFKRQTLHALYSLPKGFLLTLKALVQIKGANKRFIHTKHGIK